MAKPTAVRSKKSFSTLTIVIGVLLILSVAIGAYFTVQYIRVNNKYQAIPEVKNQETIAKVAKLIDLPKDETPTILEIKEKDKIPVTNSSKDFFEKATNGDIVLVYTKANQAVLYRSNENRVIKTDKADKLNTVTVAVLAPTDQQETTANNLQQKFGNVQIVSKGTPKTDITTSYVVDATGSNAKLAQDLASSLGLSVGQLPEGEAKPEGASLIVVIAKPVSQ